MASGFDRARFLARLATRRLGRALLVRESTASTNDDAWEALATLGDGAVVIALEQTRGRGREGRAWQHVPGRGLALSVVLRLGCDVRQAGLIPLAAGLATLQTAHALGVPAARLKWPNDVLVGRRKLAGVLCELKRAPLGGDAVVVGVGLNVRHAAEDFAPELREHATSLRLEGARDARLEDATAVLLARLEPLWDELQEGDRRAVLAEWSRWAVHWGQRVQVRTPAGEVTGVALRLDDDGGLILGGDAGDETTVRAGDLISTSTEGCDVS